MAIPDIDKQRAKCEINILTLREERDEIEEKLNKIIEINENFYQDDEFMTLNRKKGVLYREVVALEKYKANLDSQQAQKTGMKPSLEENNLSQEVFYPPVVQYSHGSISQATVPMSVAPFPPNVPEMPSQRINDFQGSYGVLNDVRGGQISNTAPVLRQNVKSAPQNFRGSVQRMEASPYSNNESFYHSAVGQQSEYPQQFSQQPYPSDIGRMAGYPHVLSPPPVSQQAYFPPPSTFIHGYDPNIPPTIRPETLRLQPQQNITRHIVSPSGDPAEKQNIAGTFRNSASDPNFSPGSDLVPELKTPQLPSVSHSKRGSLKTSGYNQRWHCQHCTMINDAGTRVCEMCHKTSDMPTFVDDDVAGAAAASEHDEETSITRAEPTGVGQRIAEVQDQIYFEKKEAHKRFQESMRKEKELEKQKKQEQIALPKSEPIENISSQHLKNPAHLERKPSQHLKPLIVDHRRSSGYGSVDTTENEYESVQLRGNHNNSLQAKHTSFQETIECINEQRHLKQMQLDGVDVVQLVKTADKHGYDIDEIQVALENCSQDGVSALEWLNQHWERMIDNVVAAVTLEGTHLDQNDVGELSASEAKEVLKACGGNMDEAVKEGLTMRKKLYAEVNREGLYARENVLEAMLQNKGDKENILISLDQTRVQPFVDRVWDTGRTEPNVLQMVINESCNSVATSVISHEDFQEQVKNKDVDLERRIRMIMVEARLISWGRAETVIKILDHDLETMDQGYECTLEDIVEAVRNCQDRRSSLVYLQRECQLCFTKYPMSKIRNLNFCQCQMCVDCLKQNFEVAIREKHVRNWVCPLCGLPDLNNENITSEYLSFLAMLLQTMMDKEVQDLFETKVRDWHLQKDPNFRWCAHCGNGFLFQDVRLDMTCPHCTKKSCFKCKKQWEDQHKGLTCEEFEQWKIDNDPENQAIGLAKHLEESGIDCPSCKMRYSLAKGGCMHFKCPQCVHEFCSGCYQPFYKKGACKRFKQCQNQGFHCHHPRDCFFYLRDNDVKDLQKLLEDGKIDFNTATPANQEQPNRCPVMEQKEYDYGKQDEACGKEVPNGHAGLCVNHYKEYLVGLINRKRLDPVRIMSHEDMNRFLLRMEIQVPKKRENENNTAYKKRLAQMIKDRFPLQRS